MSGIHPRQPLDLEGHADTFGVRRLALAMETKLAEKRAEGYGGWNKPDECTVEHLANLLLDHLPKGDPVDIANFCMMLFNREGGGAALAKAVQSRATVSLSVSQDEQTASLPSRLKEAERDVADLTKALTGLTCGGSEFFSRRGDGFIADIPACLSYIAKVRESQHATIKHALHANQAAQARIKVLHGMLDEIAAAVGGRENGDEPDVYADYDALCDLMRRARAALLPQLGGENG